MAKKDLRDVAVTVLALATAYGLGILSCVVYEAKMFVDVYTELKKDQKPKNVSYRRYGYNTEES